MVDNDDRLSGVLMHRQPMSPIATDVMPQLQILQAVRAVIFDVYGTLIISGSGDVGSVDEASHDDMIAEALRSVGLSQPGGQVPKTVDLHNQINRLNDARSGPNTPKPEVDIVDVWRQTLLQFGIEVGGNRSERLVELASRYESLANPTWPMPGASKLLGQLAGAGISLGIVSNAQVFTPRLVEDLLAENDLALGGFDLDLCVFSYRFRQAKPAPRLMDVLREALARAEILPHEAIYVGNDMLNDVWSASQAGLRTAWFAGDSRSCRPRSDDPRCRSLRPDVVLSDLMQLLECLEIK